MKIFCGIACIGFLLATPIKLSAFVEPSSPPSLSLVDEQGQQHNISDADIAKLPQTTAKATDHGHAVEYSGVLLSALLQAQGVKLGKDLRGPRVASYLLLEADDGYRVVLAIGEVDPAGHGGQKWFSWRAKRMAPRCPTRRAPGASSSPTKSGPCVGFEC